MNRKMWAFVGVPVFVFFLFSCGGGGGGSSKNGSTNSPGSGGNGNSGGLVLVPGEFRFESETNKRYQNPDADARQDACETSDYYFESDNFMVFSDLTTHSNDDLRMAATKAQLAMDAILPKFEMSWSDFFAMKRIVSFSDLGRFARELSQLTYQGNPVKPEQISSYFTGKIPDGFSTLEEQAAIYNLLINEEDPTTALTVINNARTAYDAFVADDPQSASPLSDITPIHAKIQICATSDGHIARSSTSGIKIATEYSNPVYEHQAVHTIINQLSKFPAFWAKEGQTHVFLGEEVPTSLTDVASIREAYISGTDGTDPGIENMDKFKKAYVELRKQGSLDSIALWHRRSMLIEAEWLNANGTMPAPNDNNYGEYKLKREGKIKDEFGTVMPASYDAFFDSL